MIWYSLLEMDLAIVLVSSQVSAVNKSLHIMRIQARFKRSFRFIIHYPSLVKYWTPCVSLEVPHIHIYTYVDPYCSHGLQRTPNNPKPGTWNPEPCAFFGPRSPVLKALNPKPTGRFGLFGAHSYCRGLHNFRV